MPDATVQVEDEAAVQVEVEGTEPPIEAKEPPKEPKEPKAAVDEAAKALTEAQRRVEEERRAREAADAALAAERQRAEQEFLRRQQLEAELASTRDEASASQLGIITSSLDAQNRELTSAKLEYKSAHEAGDIDRMAEAQARMAKAAAAIDRLEATKAEFEAGARRAPLASGRVEAEPVQMSAFEAYVVGDPRRPRLARAQSWLRAHPECVPPEAGGDMQKHEAMLEGHYAAKRQGYKEGSDDYFRVIEEIVGYRTPEPKEEPKSKPEPKRMKAAPSAPPSREPPTSQPTVRTVRLDPAQQEVALLSFPKRNNEEEDAWRKRAFGLYAAELVKAQSEGKLGRLTH